MIDRFGHERLMIDLLPRLHDSDNRRLNKQFAICFDVFGRNGVFRVALNFVRDIDRDFCTLVEEIFVVRN